MQRARMDTSWLTVSIGVHALASGVGAVVTLARSNGNEAPPLRARFCNSVAGSFVPPDECAPARDQCEPRAAESASWQRPSVEILKWNAMSAPLPGAQRATPPFGRKLPGSAVGRAASD
jgi:hypothetical protein